MTALFEKGREAFGLGNIAWTSATIKAALLDTTVTSTAVKPITGASNATPIVMTVTAHGYVNGDIVYQDSVGGNLAANGIWQVAGVTTNTYNLTNPVSAANAVGSAAYTSGGFGINLGPTIANLSDISGGVIGTAVALTSPTMVQGVANAAGVTFTSVSGNPVKGLFLYKDTGTGSTSTLIMLNMGKFIVTADATAASSATSVVVEALTAGIPNGTTLTFSDGKTATLSALAAAGDRVLTVSALATGVTVGARALAGMTGSNLPVTPNGGNITITWDAGVNKIFKL
jgi:hypothetical protein